MKIKKTIAVLSLIMLLCGMCSSAYAGQDDFSTTTFTGSDGSYQGTATTAMGTTNFTNANGGYGGSAQTAFGTTNYTNADGSYGGSSFTTE